jgi:hypothetical protein
MAEIAKAKTLELRVVELENMLKNLQLVDTTTMKPYRCLVECSCGPCNDRFSVAASLVSIARIAQLAGVMDDKAVDQVTAVAKSLTAQGR